MPIMPSNAGMAIEAAIAATSCLCMANTNASRSRVRIDKYVSAGMILVICYASRQLSAGMHSNLLTFVSLITLAVATVVVNTNSNILALVHVAQCVKAVLFSSESILQVDTISSILIHAAVAFHVATPLAKQTIARHIRGVLHVDTFGVIKGFENGSRKQASAVQASEFKEQVSQSQSFYIDTTQKFFLVRAVLRACMREFVFILTGVVACQYVLHYRQLLFARILGTFVAEYSGNTVDTLKLVALWSVLALAKPASQYILYSKKNILIEKMRCMIMVKTLDMYMTKGSNGLDPQTIQRAISGGWKLKSGLGGLFSIAVSSFSELFSIYIVVTRLGWGSILPVVIAVVYVFLQSRFDIYAMKLRNTAASALPPKFQQKYDNICQHMKTIKLYGWESVFVHEIGLGKVGYVTPPLVWLAKLIMSTLNSSLSEIAASLAIISQLRPDSSLSYVDLTIILSSMSSLVAFTRSLGSISDQLNQIAETEAVVKQIVDAQRVNYIVRKTAAKDTAVKMKDSEFSWGKEKFSIRSSALEIKQGEFVAIVGKVGCGKSSMVSALCGEMPLVKGEACIFESIGYVSQKPWIMNGTFRENVLLGSEYDEERYKQIIEACALVEDLAQMPAGDMSEIGHAGINLSGGQKTRLALARAIYMEAKVFILDDLLSAVDAHVERHLVEHVLVGNGLLADKTRILVTHAEHVVPLCDKIITIDHGDIIVTAQTKVSYNGMPVQDSVSSVELAEAGAKPISQETKTAKSGEFTVAPELDVPAFNQQTLWKYIALSGYANVATAVALQFVFSYCFYYVEGLRMGIVNDAGTELVASALKRYLIAHATISIMRHQINAISRLINSRLWSDRVDTKMTNLMVEALLYTPLPVFERMSKGTLSKIMHEDIMLASMHLPVTLCNQAYKLSNALNSLILAIRTTPIALISLLPLLFILRLANKRIESVKETIIGVAQGSGARQREIIIQEMLAGKEIMRAHDKVDHYLGKLAGVSAEAAILENHSMRIFALKARVDEFVVEILHMCILLYCQFARLSNPHSFGPGKVDMMMRHSGSTLTKLSAISFADMGITMCLPSLSRFYVYTEQLGREAPHVIKETQPSANWPVQGAIEFRGYSMRYRSELDTVLDQLSFTINGKEKVGIVGRTGAGKSSLTYALLRLVEPAMGSVFIDGIDTSTIGLHTLKSNISIVPQDPVLFEGTVRDNLDPRREYTDAQVWEAIEKAKIGHLLTTPTGVFDSSVQPSGTTLVRNPIGKWIAGVGLDKWVSLNGTNFSVGERQLVSLCRALLWQRAILIMDEATANIDSATDQIMQAVIREEFKDKTVLTIAHRLNTVMSCDRILVMDAGKVQEFDSPSELLSRDSHFSRLVESMKFNKQTKE